MERQHNYRNYHEYVEKQLEKTSDKKRQKKWLGKEWRLKIDIFKKLFINNIKIIEKSNKCLCLGSRTGQEVLAFKELGIIDTIGIDLHEFKPYTLKGDIHNLDFEDNYFDLEFTNIFDHSLYPEKFVEEIHRTLKPKGYIILHFQFGICQDSYTETIIKDKKMLNSLFSKFTFVSKREIDSGIIAMNNEIIFQKN